MTEVDEMNSAFFEDLLLVEEPGLEVCSLEKGIKLRRGTWKKKTNLGVALESLKRLTKKETPISNSKKMITRGWRASFISLQTRISNSWR